MTEEHKRDQVLAREDQRRDQVHAREEAMHAAILETVKYNQSNISVAVWIYSLFLIGHGALALYSGCCFIYSDLIIPVTIISVAFMTYIGLLAYSNITLLKRD